jgi:hypothetical protein
MSKDYIWWYRIQTVLLLTTGTMLLMWLGEQITERGIGNGVSLIITIGIVASLPAAVGQLKEMFWPGAGIEPPITWSGGGVDGGDDCAGHRGCDCCHAGPAEDSGAIRPTCGGPQNLCRSILLHAFARQLRGRDAGDFCFGHPDVSAENFLE